MASVCRDSLKTMMYFTTLTNEENPHTFHRFPAGASGASAIEFGLGGFCGAFAFVGVEDALTEAEVVWGNFYEFIGGDVFDGTFQRKLDSGSEPHGDPLGGGTMVGTAR